MDSDRKPGFFKSARNGFFMVVVSCLLAACGGGDGYKGNSLAAPSAAGAAPLYTTAPSSITIATGAEPLYGIGGGTAPFRVTSSDESVATLSVSNTDFKLKGVKAGAATVLIRDAAGGTQSLNVTVSPTATLPMLVSPATASASIGDVLVFKVSGGSAGYEVLVNNTSIASQSPSTVPNSGDGFSLKLLKVGSTTIAVTDTLGQTQTVTLNVDAGDAKLRLAPSALTIDENFTGNINFNIYGGAPGATFTVFTSDQALFSLPSLDGSANSFTLGLGTAGSRCIDPNGVAPAKITDTLDIKITIVDQAGASAVGVITIRDNAKGCS